MKYSQEKKLLFKKGQHWIREFVEGEESSRTSRRDLVKDHLVGKDLPGDKQQRVSTCGIRVRQVALCLHLFSRLPDT